MAGEGCKVWVNRVGLGLAVSGLRLQGIPWSRARGFLRRPPECRRRLWATRQSSVRPATGRLPRLLKAELYTQQAPAEVPAKRRAAGRRAQTPAGACAVRTEPLRDGECACAGRRAAAAPQARPAPARGMCLRGR